MKLSLWTAPLLAFGVLLAACGGVAPTSASLNATPPTCESSPCGGRGGTLSVCTSKSAAGECTGITYEVGGTTFACASCVDCVQAESSAAVACEGSGSGSGSGSGGSGSGSGGSGSGSGSGGSGSGSGSGSGGSGSGSGSGGGGSGTTCGLATVCGTEGVTAAQCTTRVDGQCESMEFQTTDGKTFPCAACGNCTAAAQALASYCGTTCNPGYHPCGGACVSSTSVSSCGTSCTPCSAPADSVATCNGTSCGFSCDSGYHLCGGACVSTSSVSSCGASCTPCSAPADAVATCDGTSCGFSCDSGYHVCGSVCDLDTSTASCGSACNPCTPPANATATCNGVSCGYTCDPGLVDCGGSCATSCSAVVRYGYPNLACVATYDSFGADYLLGEQITVSTTITVTALAVTTYTTAGYDGIVALYTSSGGAPGTLIAETSSTALVVGANEIPVTPVVVAAGTYWIMADYSAAATICADTSTTNVIDYESLSYGAAPPATFGSASTFTRQLFAYYVVGH